MRCSGVVYRLVVGTVSYGRVDKYGDKVLFLFLKNIDNVIDFLFFDFG